MPLVVELEGGEAAFEALYEIGEQIGQGSFGKVYACRAAAHSGNEVPVEQQLCVKIVPFRPRRSGSKPSSSDGDVAAGEAGATPRGAAKRDVIKLIEGMEHPNIVRYHRFVQTSDALYVVMERCVGPELLDHAEANGQLLPFAEVRGLAQQILGALATVHGLGLMHRDVKPENFRFKDRAANTLQLLDFGGAKPDDGAEPRAHTVSGTLLYAAPEVFDRFYCRSCDMWSAGVVLFVLVSGQLPFETSNVTMLRSMHRDPVLTGDSLLRGERWKQAPRGARGLVRELLRVDPVERLSSAAATDHPWLVGSLESDVDDSATPSSTLKRVNSSRVGLAELRRSYFTWNLAECNSSDAEED
jgi:serine/threonine protein kinase